jgi:hypothetical protein
MPHRKALSSATLLALWIAVLLGCLALSFVPGLDRWLFDLVTCGELGKGHCI